MQIVEYDSQIHQHVQASVDKVRNIVWSGDIAASVKEDWNMCVYLFQSINLFAKTLENNAHNRTKRAGQQGQ